MWNEAVSNKFSTALFTILNAETLAVHCEKRLRLQVYILYINRATPAKFRFLIEWSRMYLERPQFEHIQILIENCNVFDSKLWSLKCTFEINGAP
jgi:hypothetical protein